jgi:2-iminoacetate synthase
MKSVDDFIKLLSPQSGPSLEKMAHQAAQLTRQRFGKTIQLFAPLYISNECVCTCTYCGFSFANQVPRKTLTLEEVVKEADYLTQQGFRHLLLVAGEHRGAVPLPFLKEIVTSLRPQLGSLTIETTPYQTHEYQELAEAGVDGVVLYQETYDRDNYQKLHLGGPKKDYDKRIEAPDRVAQGNMRRLGMGILLGLSDWRQDALALYKHISRLRKKYWQMDFTISFPRLRHSASDFKITHPVSDREFTQLICAFRIAFPDIGLVLSTREPALMRNGLLNIGITHMSAGSSTEPGGYQIQKSAEEQFAIADHRSATEVAHYISQQGLEPVWKDWEPSLH